IFTKTLLIAVAIISTVFFSSCDGLTSGAEPSITGFSSDGKTVEYGGNLTFTVTGKVESGVMNSTLTDYDTTIKLYVDNNETKIKTLEFSSANNFDENFTISFADFETGTHVVKASVFDASGKEYVYDDTITITVEGAIEATGITLDKSTVSIAYSGSTTLTATITPSDVTSKTVTWTSSDTDVATVSGTSTSGEITAKSSGTTTITATINGNKATCSVTVKSPDGTSFDEAKTLKVGTSASAGKQYVTLAKNNTENYFKVELTSTSNLCFAKTSTFSLDCTANIYDSSETSVSSSTLSLPEYSSYVYWQNVSKGTYYIVLKQSRLSTTSGYIYCWKE
ncbi:MAG: Ig-like domain-containing protein, partial [Spirochaetales bacterium]|nr:Ig-like domain-containing protein [Spirochaetales bacterium]